MSNPLSDPPSGPADEPGPQAAGGPARDGLRGAGTEAPASPPKRGLWFEDFALGQRYATPARTVTEADVVRFAALSGDDNPIHTDAAFAARTPFRRRVAHGLLVQSIATGLAHRAGLFDGTIVAIAHMGIDFSAPVFPGDTVSVQLKVAALDPTPRRRRGWVEFQVEVHNQRGETVTSGRWRTVMLRSARA